MERYSKCCIIGHTNILEIILVDRIGKNPARNSNNDFTLIILVEFLILKLDITLWNFLDLNVTRIEVILCKLLHEHYKLTYSFHFFSLHPPFCPFCHSSDSTPLTTSSISLHNRFHVFLNAKDHINHHSNFHQSNFFSYFRLTGLLLDL